MTRMMTRVGHDAVTVLVRKDGRVTTASSRLDVPTVTVHASLVTELSWVIAMVRWAQRGETP